MPSAIWHSQARPALVNGSPVNFTKDRDAQNGLITGSSIGGVSDSISYNGFAEPIGYDATFNGSSLYNVSYVRDAIGRISSKTETVNGVTTTFDYHYDLAGRLTGVDKNGIASSTYTYDSNGNRLSYSGELGSFSGTYDAQDRLLSYGDFVYEYTANGELSKKTNVVTGEVWEYVFDVFGNLLYATLPNRTSVEFIVDAENRRIAKKINGQLVQGFLFKDKLRIVAELDAAGAVKSRFVFGPKGHVPDLMIKGGITYRFITDNLGSIRSVVNVQTGLVVQQIEYDAFGNVLDDSNPGFQPFGYAGGLYDSDTEMVRFGARDYAPWLGRWTAKDPMLFEGRSWNLFGYVINDPINRYDPTGLVDATACAKCLAKLSDDLKNPAITACENELKSCDTFDKQIEFADKYGGAYGTGSLGIAKRNCIVFKSMQAHRSVMSAMQDCMDCVGSSYHP